MKKMFLTVFCLNIAILLASEIETEKTYCNQGFEKIKTNDYAGAIADFRKSITISPNYAEAYYGRGYSEAMQKDLIVALKDYDKAIAINPRSK